jgi:hypothetical protein
MTIPDTSVTNQGYTSHSPEGFFPPNSIITRGCNHGRRLQSATFRGYVAWSGNTCKGPSVQFGMHRPPAASAEGDRQRQRESGDSSRPNVTNISSIPGNRDYVTIFYQANV